MAGEKLYDERLIVALDVDTLSQARSLIAKLHKHVKIFKIGSKLFTAVGPAAIDLVHKRGCKVFLDLKLHDIPNTVAGAAEVICLKKVFMFNIHASGGREMMSAASMVVAKAAKKSRNYKPLLIGVTVLTSSSEVELKDLGIKRFVKDQALALAKMAKESGLSGVVASPHEVKRIKQLCGKNFIVVTPGVRPAGAALQDQKRVMTPEHAVREGSDYIVVGRPIIEAEDPVKAAKDIIKMLENL